MMMLLPFAFLLTMTCVVLFVGKRAYCFAQTALLGTLALTLYPLLNFIEPVWFAEKSMVFDNLALIASALCLFLTFCIFIYIGKMAAEFYALCLFSLLGMLVMFSAHNMMTLYLAIELMSLPLYALCAFQRTSTAGSEAAIKYFVTGAIASGFLLYGISLVYGAAHSFDFAMIAQAHSTMLLVGITFMLAGFAFKLGLVPFHMWAPDVYEGSPTVSLLFISSVPKLATIVLVIRLFYESFAASHSDWMQLMNILAVLSILVGNVVALRQDNIKRLFAYSSIAHMGYALLGLAVGTSFALSATLFYVISYLLMAVGGFAILALLNAQSFNDLSGLNARHPWLAFMMLLFVFSMAGVPPTIGFIAKLTILMTLVKTHEVAMAVYVVLMAVTSLYYYLRIIKVMYFEKPLGEHPEHFHRDTIMVLSMNGLGVLVLGILPAGLLALCAYCF